MKNKYYYQGVLVRTSDHEYTHAVISTNGEFTKGKLVGCRTSEQAARQIISSEISGYMNSIRNCEEAIKALKAGKTGYWAKEGRRSYPYRFLASDTIEKYERALERTQRGMEYIETYWKVVELTKGE